MEQEPMLNIKIIFEQPKNQEVKSSKRIKRSKSMNMKLESKDQLIQNFPITQYLRKSKKTKKNQLMLQKLLQGLSEQTQISFEGKEISFYINKANMYMKCGCYPLSKNILINEKNYKNKEDQIIILAKHINKPTLNGILLNQFNLNKYTRNITQNCNQNQQTQKQKNKKIKRKLKSSQQKIQQKQYLDEILDLKAQSQNQQQGYGGRQNQRLISLAILRVSQWVKLQRNKQIKCTLEEAAKLVEIPKKSLDRYLKQIKFGYDHKFNFNQQCMKKTGQLLKRNELNKKKLPYQKGQQKKFIRKIINQIQQQDYEQQKKQRKQNVSRKTKLIKKY